ncbi:hypothetical protein JHL17_04115 [Azospirillum sp. YIM B02556]|uniref:Uncharacterized protein n=1 Tax=Azospirillum endophyticum TaxID=2800326 RepID=A0ABS1EZJ0_9PROT|nr:hypothetical protein [Azospirillum endophyticum]MBK1836588.1 hypothetical protein [Azospirillum endophyticum]
MADEKPASSNVLTNEPDRDIADPLDAARAVSDTGKPITPGTESAKHIDRPARKDKAKKKE